MSGKAAWAAAWSLRCEWGGAADILAWAWFGRLGGVAAEVRDDR